MLPPLTAESTSCIRSDEADVKLNRVDIRKTHPGLYHAIMTLGVMGVALGFNFWFSNPTFDPWPGKNIVGVVFFLLGISKLVFLNLVRNLRMVRILMATAISFMFFWGLTNTQQFFAGNASLQLPILYMALSILQLPLLVEPPINPVTAKSIE